MRGALHRFWQQLKPVFHAIGRVQSALVLSLVYALFWVPAGLMTRLLADWLHWREPKHSNWVARAQRINEPSHVHEPF